MYTVYALKSKSRNYIYVWMTNNLERRKKEHNLWRNQSTKAYAPFELIYKENYENRVEARLREKYLKNWCWKEMLRSL